MVGFDSADDSESGRARVNRRSLYRAWSLPFTAYTSRPFQASGF
jgi:hypothetical protein